MSQLQNGADSPARAHPSPSNTDSNPPTPTPTKPETRVEITSHRVSAVNISEAFGVAAAALKTGQLVKDEYFTLFEAVSALEIMDSKMDSGHLEPGETLEDEYDVLRDLLPEEVLGIMDQILCHEAAWHMGHPLSQTLFTSLYIERLLWPEPKTLEEAQFSRGPRAADRNSLLLQALRSYCIATVKASYFVHSMITRENYYEVGKRSESPTPARLSLTLYGAIRKRTLPPKPIIGSSYQSFRPRKYRLCWMTAFRASLPQSFLSR